MLSKQINFTQILNKIKLIHKTFENYNFFQIFLNERTKIVYLFIFFLSILNRFIYNSYIIQ